MFLGEENDITDSVALFRFCEYLHIIGSYTSTGLFSDGKRYSGWIPSNSLAAPLNILC